MPSIVMTGLARSLTGIGLLAEGGRAAGGPLAAWTSRLPYAGPVEYRWRAGSGGARMFEKGMAETAAAVPGLLGPALLRGPASVGAATRSIQTLGVTNIRKYTPVRSGALRASVVAVTRPRGA